MAFFFDKCRICGRTYTNYSFPMGWRPFCSVGCEVEALKCGGGDLYEKAGKEGRLKASRSVKCSE